MANVGVSRPYYAKYTVADNGAVSYSNGARLGKAVSVAISPDGGDPEVFYADNGPAEIASVFAGGTLTITVDNLEIEVAAAILGLTVESATEPAGSGIRLKGDSMPPYLGFGTIFKQVKDGTTKWVAFILHKVQFQTPEFTQDTQSETIEFAGQELSAAILRDDTENATWCSFFTFTTEANAEAFIKKELNITTD